MNYKDFKLKRVKRVPVSGAFHTKLMFSDNHLGQFKDLLKSIKFEKPSMETYSNLTATTYDDVQYNVRCNLIKQIYQPVLWEQILHRIYERRKDSDEPFPETYECGPGTQLGTILKQVNNRAFLLYKNVYV